MTVSNQITTPGLQSSGGSPQEMTQAGLTAWIDAVNGFRRGNAGKKRLFTSTREDLIRTSRRDND